MASSDIFKHEFVFSWFDLIVFEPLSKCMHVLKGVTVRTGRSSRKEYK